MDVTAATFAILAAAAGAHAGHAGQWADADRVHTMPSYGPPPTPTFSGFLNADAAEPGTRLHYHFAVSSRARAGELVDKAGETIPVVLWLNGGPGSSSYLGLFQELGPLLINGTGGLFENPYAWTTRAHLLVLESPAGVGYSYCKAQLAGGGCVNTDKSTAAAARAAVADFYTAKFPELRHAPLYLTGESYAGVYVPTLALELLEHAHGVVPLAGLAVGDPCTDNKLQHDSMDMVWYAHKYGLLPDADFQTLWHSCEYRQPSALAAGRWHAAADGSGLRAARAPSSPPSAAPPSAACTLARRKFLATTSRGFSQTWARAYLNDLTLYGPSATATFDVPRSLDALTAAYLSRADVRAALHVERAPAAAWPGPAANWSYTSDYAACNEASRPGVPSMIAFHRKLAPSLKRTLVFNGDTDPCVSYEGTREAVRQVGFPEVKGGSYRPWFFNASAAAESVLRAKPLLFGPSLALQPGGAQMGGSVVDYAHGLSFLTVHGSGHMCALRRLLRAPSAVRGARSRCGTPPANTTGGPRRTEHAPAPPSPPACRRVPQFRPRAALHLLDKLLSGEPFSPPLPSDDELRAISEDDFDAAVDSWTDAARAAPYVTPC